MPTYEYHCTNCYHTEEIFQKITEASLTDCPMCCKKAFQRGPGGGIGLAFKGTGYYITDYGSAKSTSEKNPVSSEKPASCCPCDKNTPKCN
jgi:putative FmdB family regulatory protein